MVFWAGRFACVAIIGLLTSLGTSALANAASQKVQPVFSEHTLRLPPSRCIEPLPEFWPHYLVLRRDPGALLLHPEDDPWWERGLNPADASAISEWPFTHLFRDQCGPVVWIAGELSHA